MQWGCLLPCAVSDGAAGGRVERPWLTAVIGDDFSHRLSDFKAGSEEAIPSLPVPPSRARPGLNNECIKCSPSLPTCAPPFAPLLSRIPTPGTRSPECMNTPLRESASFNRLGGAEPSGQVCSCGKQTDAFKSHSDARPLRVSVGRQAWLC